MPDPGTSGKVRPASWSGRQEISSDSTVSEKLLRQVLIAHWRWTTPMVMDLMRVVRRAEALDKKVRFG